ncbi:AFR159Cp [Eremothecium gossypii ATCC 10895]|uniref:AFR159Cp n=1 Tax=Eremothecium gossypii (strain ATCC 10895 / CBS 109.51 / FGSC 9923 / NRRL Y-1056) TaxID=284811 RepID=Q754H9_EREGS|nr:AFR159Cp [Eremothecium gossypii ATCC 10895]AAS53530.1 AFR159Cp [Eremothecium gossypii ATCC 10895]AEY97843.1 FAFR159Cp [Eremothecium gossypii FDAG1]
MSDYEALLRFNKMPVSVEMVHFLASTTASIIQVRSEGNSEHILSLVDFIKGLVKRSNVQTPTLMSTVVYLARLRSIIPANVYGIETSRHRMFLGCLILAAKNLNDSSPMNKHWCRYTDGLLSLREVNTIERELLEYFNWNLRITNQDLISCLSHFLNPIRDSFIRGEQRSHLLFHVPLTGQTKQFILQNGDVYSSSSSNMSIPSLVSSRTISTISTNGSRCTARSALAAHQAVTMECIQEERLPKLHLREANITSTQCPRKGLTRPVILQPKLNTFYDGAHSINGTSDGANVGAYRTLKNAGWTALFS